MKRKFQLLFLSQLEDDYADYANYVNVYAD